MAVNHKAIAENGFDIHERATSASRIGRVRQIVSLREIKSEVKLEVRIVLGLPLTVQGTVITKAKLDVKGPELWETEIITTEVKGSNIPYN